MALKFITECNIFLLTDDCLRGPGPCYPSPRPLWARRLWRQDLMRENWQQYWWQYSKADYVPSDSSDENGRRFEMKAPWSVPGTEIEIVWVITRFDTIDCESLRSKIANGTDADSQNWEIILNREPIIFKTLNRHLDLFQEVVRTITSEPTWQ